MATDGSSFTASLRRTVLEFCKDNYLFNDSVTIQGIICLTPEDSNKDTTVRFHNRLVKNNEKITSFEAEFNLKKLSGVSNEAQTNDSVNKNQEASTNDAGDGQIPLSSIKVEVSEAEEGEIPDDEIHMDQDEGAATVTTTGDNSKNDNSANNAADNDHQDVAVDDNDADPGSPSKLPSRLQNNLDSSPSLRAQVQPVQNSPNRTISEIDSEICASSSPRSGIKSYEKVYVCDVCEKTFLQKQLLQLHKLGHRDTIIDSMRESARLVDSLSTDGTTEKPSCSFAQRGNNIDDIIESVISSSADLTHKVKVGKIKVSTRPSERTLTNHGTKAKRRWINKPQTTKPSPSKKCKSKDLLNDSMDELLADNDLAENADSLNLVVVNNQEGASSTENVNALGVIVDYNEGVINRAPEEISLNSTTFLMEQNMDFLEPGTLLGDSGEANMDCNLQAGDTDFTCGVCKSSFMDSIGLKAHQAVTCNTSHGTRLRSRLSKELSQNGGNSSENLPQLGKELSRNKSSQVGAGPKKNTQRISRRKGLPKKRTRKIKQENAAPSNEEPVDKAAERVKLEIQKKSPVKLEYDVVMRPYSCSKCDQSYKTKAHMQAHELTHSDVKPFTCNTCHKGFYRKDHLRIHTRIHTGEKPFKCHYCQVSFSDRSNLKAHIGRHIGHRPYKCDLCPSKFFLRQELIDHSNMHAGNKEYICEACNKRFTYRSTLNKHKRDICCIEKSPLENESAS